MNFNLDVAIFIGFLALNLVVGLRYGREVKTIKEYALGGKDFSTAALVSTIVATWASGSMFFLDLTTTYSSGLYYFIPSVFMCLQLFLTSYLLIPRMGEFLNNTSVAEAMGDLYGKEIRLITAFCGLLSMVGFLAVQFRVFGSIFNYFLGIEPTYAIFLASAIVVLYSSFGGIKAVTYTDVIQFFTFGFVIPLIGIILWNQINDSNISFSATITDSNFDYKKVLNFSNPEFWAMIPLLICFSIPFTSPTSFQRISMGRSIEQARKAWLIAAILFVFVTIAIAWIPFLIKIIEPDLGGDKVISYLIGNYSFSGLKGLMIIGISAMVMSTADSYINASSILFANDIGKILNLKMDELVLSKLFAVSLGVFAIYLALSKTDLLSIVLTSSSFYSPIVSVPLLLAIFGFRSTKPPVLIGMAAALIVVLTLKFFKFNGAEIILYGIMTNLVCFVGSHILLRQEGGCVGIKDTRYLDYIRYERARKRAAFFELIKKFNFIEFCKNNSPKNEVTYMWLGIYFIIYTLTTMYTTHAELLKENGKIILTIYQIMMITGVLMAMYPIWPVRIKHEIIVQVAWNIVIFYMLIFFTCFFVMVSDFGKLQLVVFALNVLIAAVLIGWETGLIMAVTGFYLSVQFYKYYAGVAHIDPAVGSPQFIFAYVLIFAGSVLVIFFKLHQESTPLTEEENEHLSGRLGFQEKELQQALALKGEFIRNVSHEYRASMTGISSRAGVVLDSYEKLTDEQRKASVETILQSSVKLETFDNNISSLSKLSKANYELKLETINLSDLLYERLRIGCVLYEKSKTDTEFVLNIEENVTFNGDKYYLTQLLDNLIINAFTYCPKGKITITLKQPGEVIELDISDEGAGIPPDELFDIFAEFTVSSKTRSPAGNRGIGLSLCKMVVEAHNGTIQAKSDGKKGADFKVQLPGFSVKS